MNKFIFPKDFMWGVATSAFQIEGAADEDGKGESIWDRFSHTHGKIKNNDNGDIACDHYHRFNEDIDRLKKLGVGSYRFSFAWTRIMPDGRGKINQKGLDFYKRLVDNLLGAGIVPNATLYHWDLPQKLQDMGGWASRDSIHYFTEYAKILFDTFGDLIPYWVTFNEPNAVQMGYSEGVFAPGYKDAALANQVKHNMLLAHGEAVRAFRGANLKNAKIGIVLDIWKHHPARECEADKLLALDGNEEQHGVYLEPLFYGRYSEYLTAKREKNNTMPLIFPGDMERISVSIDFLGINCYSRFLVSEDKSLVDIDKRIQDEPEKFNSIKWELYTESIYDAVMMIKEKYDNALPIYITENGGPFEDMLNSDKKICDLLRINMLNSYLGQLHRAINDGANVKGYYVWSLMDNFEWAEGFSKRFGLLYVDFNTLERLPKDSFYWYKNVVETNSILL